MKKLIVCFMLTIVCLNNTFADNVVFLDKDKPAPFAGYLMDQEKVDKIRLLNIDYQEALKTKEYLQKDNDLYAKRLDNLTQYNDKLATEVVSLRENSIWSKIGFFILGAAVTTGVAFGVSKAIR